MKKFLSILAVAMMSLGVCVSCDKLGDGDGSQIGGGDSLVEGQWYEEGNVLRYKQTVSGYYTMVWELTFSGDTCTKSICKYTFPNSTLADAFYQGYINNEEGLTASKSGKTVTLNWTSVHGGLSKETLKSAIGADAI